MASFLNGQTSSASFIQQNQNYPSGDLTLTGTLSSDTVQANTIRNNRSDTDVVVMEGDYLVTGQLSVNEIGISSLNATNNLTSNTVSTTFLKSSVNTRTTPYVSYSGTHTWPADQIVRGHVIRQDITGTVTDTMPTGTDFFLNCPLLGLADTMEIVVEIVAGATELNYTLLGNTDSTRTSGSYSFYMEPFARRTMKLVITAGVAPAYYWRTQIIQEGLYPTVTGLVVQDEAPVLQLHDRLDDKRLAISVDPFANETTIQPAASWPMTIYMNGVSPTYTFSPAGTFTAVEALSAPTLLMNPTSSSASAISLQPQSLSYANSCLYINTMRDASSAYNYIDCRASNNGTNVFRVTGEGNLVTIGTGAFTGAITSGGLTVTGASFHRGGLFTRTTVVTETSNVARTFTAAEVVNTIIDRVVQAAAGTITDRMPTAASLVSTYGLQVGDSFLTTLKTQNDAGFNYSFAPSATGGTAATFTTLSTGGKAMSQFRTVMTNVSSGTEAYTVWRVSHQTSAF
jgi:hypothetical protein